MSGALGRNHGRTRCFTYGSQPVGRAAPPARSAGGSADLRAGESVVITGYPLTGLLGSNMSITSGVLSSLKSLHDDGRMAEISAKVQLENSGGPFLDYAGNVVGIVSATLATVPGQGGALPQNVNFAITANDVEECR